MGKTKRRKLHRYIFAGYMSLLALGISGCGSDGETAATDGQQAGETVQMEEKEDILTTLCLDIYEKADREGCLNELDTICQLVDRFGENGYAAVDAQNQVDMVCPEQVAAFCEKVEAKEEAEATIVAVTWQNSFIKYDLQTTEGKVSGTRSYYHYSDSYLEQTDFGDYTVSSWMYTEDGYLLFSGSWVSEEIYAFTMGNMGENVALRVAPLDETCRELNRKYILPISYKKNNMFLIDWSEEDFGELDLYDLFDILYTDQNGTSAPYTPAGDLSKGTVYEIPKEIFESVIQSGLNINVDMIRSKTVYHGDSETYEYKPRGFYEREYPEEHPFPEVTDYTENNDGTLTLTVHAVSPYKWTSKVFAHEVVVRPLDNGGVQYVSNHVIPSEINGEPTWYTPRLTAEEWEEIYGKDQ